MRTIKTVLLFTFIAAGLSSCKSSKFIQNQIRILHTDLDYELTSAIQEEKTEKTVYLNYIDNSNMEYFTSVKDTKALVLPFIFYNYWHKQFNIVLGENTFTQPYWSFLSDALVAECNRSTCFQLKTSDKPDTSGMYSLDVKIIHNQTQSGIKESNSILIIPSTYFVLDFIHEEYQVLPTSSDLEIRVSLKKDGKCLLEKQYAAHENLNRKTFNEFAFASEVCISTMTECLSFATKQIVMEISQDLNLILSVP